MTSGIYSHYYSTTIYYYYLYYSLRLLWKSNTIEFYSLDGYFMYFFISIYIYLSIYLFIYLSIYLCSQLFSYLQVDVKQCNSLTQHS